MDTKHIILIAAGTLAVLAFRKRPAKKYTAQGVLIPLGSHSLCNKYPGGSWSKYHGTLAGVPADDPGWNDDDSEKVRTAVLKQIPDPIPEFKSMADARNLTFEITRNVVKSLCPSKGIPEKRTAIENYKKQSPEFEHMWDGVENIVWNKISAELGTGT